MWLKPKGFAAPEIAQHHHAPAQDARGLGALGEQKVQIFGGQGVTDAAADLVLERLDGEALHAHHPAAQDDEIGVQERDLRGHGNGGIAHEALDARIVAVAHKDVGDGAVGERLLAQRLEVAPAHQRLHAARLAAGAGLFHPVERDVAQLARRAVRPQVEAPADVERVAKAGPQVAAQNGAAALGVQALGLDVMGEDEVDVTVHENGQVQPLFQLQPQLQRVQPVDVGRGADEAVVFVDHGGHADGHGAHRAVGHEGFADDLGEVFQGAVAQQAAAAVHLKAAERVVPVHHAQADVGAADVDAQYALFTHRRPPARR